MPEWLFSILVLVSIFLCGWNLGREHAYDRIFEELKRAKREDEP